MIRLAIVMLSAWMALGALPQRASAQETTDPARIAAAQDLMDVTGVAKQMDGMMTAMISGFQQGAAREGNTPQAQAATKAFEAFMSRFGTYKADMMRDFAALYASRFTAEEMKAVADFYRGETGSKFIRQMPELMQQGSQIGIKYAQKMADDLKSGAAPAPKP